MFETTQRLEAKIRGMDHKNIEQQELTLHRIVITGGPCGGKSTVLGDLKQVLEDRNYIVFFMPEVATQAFEWSGGRLWSDHQKTWDLKLSKSVLLVEVQLAMEKAIVQMAKNSLVSRSTDAFPPRGAVVLLDRGCADYKAYCDQTTWTEVLETLGTTTGRLRDRRYDLVVHLVTAANGAEQFYTLVQAEGQDSEFSARTETAEEARALDIKTQQAWQGFHNYHIVDNRGDFSKKRQVVKEIVLRSLGEMSSDNVTVRLLCQVQTQRSKFPRQSSFTGSSLHVDMRFIPEGCKQVAVSMVYLSDTERLQRRQVEDHTATYYHQTIGSDGAVGRQYQIDSWSYMQRIKSAKDLGIQMREFEEDLLTFTYGDAYFRCHIFNDDASEADGPTTIVEADSTSGLPPWLKLIKDVTTGHRYSSFPLA